MKDLDELELKLLNNESVFSDDELLELVFEYSDDNIELSEGRWSKRMQSIIKVEDRYFSIEWEKGLTENQEHYFNNQPYEVKREAREVVRVEVNYIKL